MSNRHHSTSLSQHLSLLEHYTIAMTVCSMSTSLSAKCVGSLNPQHKDDLAPVNCVDSNGIVIVSGSSDGAVRVYDFSIAPSAST